MMDKSIAGGLNKKSKRAWSLLARYFSMYWLKPFDAVHDTANAAALNHFDWAEPVLEVGGGDGVFSFVMHGGEFNFVDDRYAQTDPGKEGDMYDVYDRSKNLGIKKEAELRYAVGVDLKQSHLDKSAETRLYDKLLASKPENLPNDIGNFKTVFLYTFHGLTDYRRSLECIRKTMDGDGTLLMIAFNQTVSKYFVCHKLSEHFREKGWQRLAEYFKSLDNGRHCELSGFAKSLEEWKSLLQKTGFETEEVLHQVTPLSWKLYDTQTRPVLKLLIKIAAGLDKIGLKRVFKVLWMILWLPWMLLFYRIFARPDHLAPDDSSSPRIFFAIRAKVVSANERADAMSREMSEQ